MIEYSQSPEAETLRERKGGYLADNSMYFKQKFIHHLLVSRFFLFSACALAIIWHLLGGSVDFAIGAVFFLIITNLLSLYLHIEYTIKNLKQEVSIDSHKVMVKVRNKVFEHQLNDFKKVILYKSASLNDFGMPFSSMEYYYFVQLVLFNEEDIIITCLMHKDIESILSFFPKEIQERRNGLALIIRTRYSI